MCSDSRFTASQQDWTLNIAHKRFALDFQGLGNRPILGGELQGRTDRVPEIFNTIRSSSILEQFETANPL